MLSDDLQKEGTIRQAMESFHAPEPKLIFLVFLPALIFESAFNSDWYTFKRQFGKILIMATLMLVFCTFATAVSMYWVLGFQSDENKMTWMTCVLFGAINSATDPVAVVSLLKELGVTVRISTLIEGESLLNDGTALVLFIVLQDLAQGDDKTAGEIAGMFCQMSIGGPLLGIAFGYLMSFTLSRIHNEPILESNLTVCMPYVLFYIAELHDVHVSGILALVAMGLYMTNRGRTRISVESEEAIHAIWHYIGFVAETLIFLISGIVLGGTFATVKPIWILQLIGLYIFLHLIRFTGLLLCWPLMKRTGYPIDFPQIVLLSYSGLRGAVGLCLALIVKFNKRIPKEIREQIIFFTCGIVLLTLIINGTTTGLVVRKLGISRENEMSVRMLKKVLGEHNERAVDYIDKWKHERRQHGKSGGVF
jgi:NhaP-type Na+/H+ or K+/H+ antiporter